MAKAKNDIGDITRDEYMNIREVAKQFRSSQSVIYRLIGEGKLRSVKFGGKLLIAREELRKYIHQVNQQRAAK